MCELEAALHIQLTSELTENVEFSYWALHKQHAMSGLWFQIYKMDHIRFYFTGYAELKGGPAAFTASNLDVFINLTRIIANVCGPGGLQKAKMF